MSWVAGTRKTSSAARGYSLEQVMFGMMAFAALLLPYVTFEPAPVDFILVLSAITFIAYGGKVPKTALLLLIIYFGFYLASGLDSLLHGRENMMKFSRYYIVELFLLFTTLMTYSIFLRLPITRYAFLRYYVIGSVLSAIIVIFLFKFAPSFQLIYRDSARIRLDGFFKDPNVLGPYLILPALMLLFARDKINLSRIWAFAALPLVALMFLTLSRATIGSFVGALLIFLLLRGAAGLRRNTLIFFIFIILFFTASVSFLSEDVLRFLDRVQGFQARMQIQSYDSDRFHDIRHSFLVGAPRLFGLGPASYESMFDTLSPHNLFLAKLVDGGWVPALMITWFVLYPTWLSLKAFLRTRDTLYLILFSVMAAHVVNSMIVNPHHWRHLLLICALIFAMTKRPKRPHA